MNTTQAIEMNAEIEDRLTQDRIKKQLARARSLQPKLSCHYCRAPLKEHLFCDVECREEYDREEQIKQRTR